MNVSSGSNPIYKKAGIARLLRCCDIYDVRLRRSLWGARRSRAGFALGFC
jgi:hypothetical protein